jgi:glycolate oxidase FAD binding subunit
MAGSGTWNQAAGPADLILSSSGLGEVEDVRAADLVATVQAGVDRDTLRTVLADSGAWWPVDPPGLRRTLGSVIATATAGPLRSGFGSVRDHILGLTVVTADGRVIHSGGRVVKNVAGFDLTKLATGSFGAFGFITRVHLRLRAIPRADTTLLAAGERSTLVQDAQAILQAGLTPAALEILSPAAGGNDHWTLAVRLIGSDPSVTADRNALKAASSLSWSAPSANDASEFWRAALQHPMRHPIAIRMGAVITGLDHAIDLLAHHLDDESVSASVTAGAVRWSGVADPSRVQLLRHTAAQVEMPVTIERGPWRLQDELGHFGSASRVVRPTLLPAMRLTAPAAASC